MCVLVLQSVVRAPNSRTCRPGGVSGALTKNIPAMEVHGAEGPVAIKGPSMKAMVDKSLKSIDAVTAFSAIVVNEKELKTALKNTEQKLNSQYKNLSKNEVRTIRKATLVKMQNGLVREKPKPDIQVAKRYPEVRVTLNAAARSPSTHHCV